MRHHALKNNQFQVQLISDLIETNLDVVFTVGG